MISFYCCDIYQLSAPVPSLMTNTSISSNFFAPMVLFLTYIMRITSGPGYPDLVQALPMRGYPDLVRALRAMLMSKFLVPICLFTVLTSTTIINSGPGYPDLVRALPMRGYPDLVRALRAMLMSKFRVPISLFTVLTPTMRRKPAQDTPTLCGHSRCEDTPTSCGHSGRC